MRQLDGRALADLDHITLGGHLVLADPDTAPVLLEVGTESEIGNANRSPTQANSSVSISAWVAGA